MAKIYFSPDDENTLHLAASKAAKAYDWIEYYDILEVEQLKQNPSGIVDKLLQKNLFLKHQASFFPLLKKIKIEKETCKGKDDKSCSGNKEFVTFSGKQNDCEKQKEEFKSQFEYRAWYYIPVETQVYWTSIATYLAQIFEPYMSHPLEDNGNNKIYSYGNRFIKKWGKIDHEWKYEGLNVYSDAIYEPFNRGYSVFKRRIEQRAIYLTQNNRRACYIKSDLSGFYPSVSYANFKKSIEHLIDLVPLEENIKDEIKSISDQLHFEIEVSSIDKQYESLPGIANHECLKDTVLPIGLHAAGIFSNIFFLSIERKLTQFMEDNNIENVYIFRYVDDVTFLSASYTNLQEVYKEYEKICKTYGLTLHREKEDEGYIDQYNLKPFLTGILNRLSDIGKRVLPALTKKDHNNTIDELINFLETDFADHEIRPDTKDSFIVSKIVNTPFAAAEEHDKNAPAGIERLQKISKAIILAIDSHPFKYALYKRYIEFVFRHSLSNYQQTFYLEKFVRLLKEKIFRFEDPDQQKFVDFIKLSLLHYVTLQLRNNYSEINIKIAKYIAKSLKNFSSTCTDFEKKMIERSVLLLDLLLMEKPFKNAYDEIDARSATDAKTLLFFVPDALKGQDYIRICQSLIAKNEIEKSPYLLKLFMNEHVINMLTFDDLNSLDIQLINGGHV